VIQAALPSPTGSNSSRATRTGVGTDALLGLVPGMSRPEIQGHPATPGDRDPRRCPLPGSTADQFGSVPRLGYLDTAGSPRGSAMPTAAS
jgi:hypothetical protein